MPWRGVGHPVFQAPLFPTTVETLNKLFVHFHIKRFHCCKRDVPLRLLSDNHILRHEEEPLHCSLSDIGYNG